MPPSSEAQERGDILPSLHVSRANSTANAFAGSRRYAWMNSATSPSSSRTSQPATMARQHPTAGGVQSPTNHDAASTTSGTIATPQPINAAKTSSILLQSPAPTTEPHSAITPDGVSREPMTNIRDESLAFTRSNVVLRPIRSPRTQNTSSAHQLPASHLVTSHDALSPPPFTVQSMDKANISTPAPLLMSPEEPRCSDVTTHTSPGPRSTTTSTVPRAGSKRPFVSGDNQVALKRTYIGSLTPEYYSRPTCPALVEFIDEIVIDWNQFLPGINKVEGQRLHLLKRACVLEDWFYIILHRLYCHWFLDRESMFASLKADGCDHRAFPLIEASLQCLVPILKANKELRHPCRTWFSRFPADSNVQPASKLSQPSSRAVVLFLTVFCNEWPIVMGRVSARGYPLLVHEMLVMYCDSATLQLILMAYQVQDLVVDTTELFKELDANQAYESWATANNVAQSLRTEPRKQQASRFSHLILTQRNALQRRGVGNTPSGYSPVLSHTQDVPLSGQISGTPPSQLSGPLQQSHTSQQGSHHIEEQQPHDPSTPVMSPYIDRAGPVRQQGHVYHSSDSSRVQSSRAFRSPGYADFNKRPQAAHTNVGGQTARGHFQYRPVSSENNSALPSPHALLTQNAIAQVGQARGGLKLSEMPSRSAPTGGTSFQIARNAVPPTSSPQTTMTSFSQLQTRVIPIMDYPNNAWDSTSLQLGMHLVRQRSPVRQPLVATDKVFCQFIYEYAASRMLTPMVGLVSIDFSVSDSCFEDIVPRSKLEGREVHGFREGSLRMRLRVCKPLKGVADFESTSAAVAATYWPECIYISFNGTYLQPQRKQHFRHDLPIELTHLIRKGKNTVVVSIPIDPNEQKGIEKYLLTVDVIKTSSAEVIKALVGNRGRFSSESTKADIRQRLIGSNDDELFVEDRFLTISVADPFSSTLCATPVRSVHCKHVQCFDLDNWLATRQRKPSMRLTEPCKVDDWRCPICGGDARPQNIKIDDFFLEVRTQLLADGASGTKVIRVDEEGKWSAVIEQDDSDDESQASAVGPTSKPRSSHTAAVVVLDDDD